MTNKLIMKTFRISERGIKALEELQAKYEKEVGFVIAQGKIIEIAVARIKGMKLKDILNETL